jgi:hypothetical protein
MGGGTNGRDKGENMTISRKDGFSDSLLPVTPAHTGITNQKSPQPACIL